jgi:peptide/nickel transport system permease protein
MVRYLVRRGAGALVVGVVATLAGYVLASLTLDPAARYAGRKPPVPDDVVVARLAAMGVDPDVPLVVRTWRWFVALVTTGSFGQSSRGDAVTAELAARAGTSLRLLLLGTVLGVALGVAVGAWGAVRRSRWPDRVTTTTSLVLLATPAFVLAIATMAGATALNDAAGRTVLPFVGEYTPGLEGGWWAHAGDRAAHLVLPTLCVALATGAVLSRYQRAAMLDVLSAEHLRTARATGLPYRTAVLRHGLRVALAPMSGFVAYTFGFVLTGAAVTEIAFGWHGMGEYLVQSVVDDDVNAAAGTVAVTAAVVLVAGLVADGLHAALDPRVRA